MSTAATGFTDLAEHLGCTRCWVAEHHNMPGNSSSAPAVLIGHIDLAIGPAPGTDGPIARALGWPFAFAHQFSSANTMRASCVAPTARRPTT